MRSGSTEMKREGIYYLMSKLLQSYDWTGNEGSETFGYLCKILSVKKTATAGFSNGLGKFIKV